MHTAYTVMSTIDQVHHYAEPQLSKPHDQLTGFENAARFDSLNYSRQAAYLMCTVAKLYRIL